MEFFYDISVNLIASALWAIGAFIVGRVVYLRFKKRRIESFHEQSVIHKTTINILSKVEKEKEPDTFLHMGIYPMPSYMKGLSKEVKAPRPGERF